MESSRNRFDLLLDLSRDRHRRIVLGIFADQQRRLTIADLVKTILRHDREEPLIQVSGEEFKQIRSLLHHSHIPRMEKADFVEYDRETRRIKPTEELLQIAPHVIDLLEIDPDIDTPVEL
jgi:HEPN domain-containing protein